MTAIPNQLSSRFDDPAARRELIRLYGDSPNMFGGVNAEGEEVLLSISREKGIFLRTNQKNGLVRVNYYDKDGHRAGETFDGRWTEEKRQESAKSRKEDW